MQIPANQSSTTGSDLHCALSCCPPQSPGASGRPQSWRMHHPLTGCGAAGIRRADILQIVSIGNWESRRVGLSQMGWAELALVSEMSHCKQCIHQKARHARRSKRPESIFTCCTCEPLGSSGWGSGWSGVKSQRSRRRMEQQELRVWN